MKVDRPAIDTISAKVDRAHEHLEVLDREFRDYLKRKPFRVEPEYAPDGRLYQARLRYLEPMPPMWSVVLGELVHDLRSALDQVVYWLTIDHQRAELAMTGFPIFTRRIRHHKEGGFADSNSRFPGGHPGSGLHMIRGVGPGPQAFMERLQPYPQRHGPIHKSLLALHEFWNQDKHRLVHLWGLVVLDTELALEGEGGSPSRCIPWLSPHVLQEGAVVARIRCDPPVVNMVVRGESEFSVAVKNPGPHRRRVAVNIKQMANDVGLVVGCLIGAIGDQSSPIRKEAIPADRWVRPAPSPPQPASHT